MGLPLHIRSTPLVRALAGAGLASCALAAGCGSTDASTPPACLGGVGTYERALAAAPSEVRLKGDVPISGCLTQNQDAGDLANVGKTMIDVATGLNSEALAQPGGPAAVRLGYLVGAVDSAAGHTEGIHAELLRRLVTAASYKPAGKTPGREFERAYREGFEAGSNSG